MSTTVRRPGIGAGIMGGVILSLIALGFGTGVSAVAPDVRMLGTLSDWLDSNLGYAVWLFLLVFAAYAFHLNRLSNLLDAGPTVREVVQLDQLIDVWTHLFVGIGVIWTAIGMRSALQAALGESNAALADSAGDVLQRLVDGGILLALSTTIVGGFGGYLMRLCKTLYLGAPLQAFYEDVNHAELRELVILLQRIDQRLNTDPQPDSLILES